MLSTLIFLTLLGTGPFSTCPFGKNIDCLLQIGKSRLVGEMLILTYACLALILNSFSTLGRIHGNHTIQAFGYLATFIKILYLFLRLRICSTKLGNMHTFLHWERVLS